MFREMKRKKQELKKEEALEILRNAKNGVLSVIGDDGYPYGVPLTPVCIGDKLYLHSSKAGHKIDSIENNPKVCFTVIAKDDIVQEEFTTYFRSVIVFGTAKLINDKEEMVKRMRSLGEKFSPEYKGKGETVIKNNIPALTVIEITIEHITGKEAIELTQMRK